MTTTEDLRRLKNSARKTNTARKKSDDLWEEHKALIRAVYEHGELSYQQIADTVGLTKARVWQIATGYTTK